MHLSALIELTECVYEREGLRYKITIFNNFEK